MARKLTVVLLKNQVYISDNYNMAIVVLLHFKLKSVVQLDNPPRLASHTVQYS